MCIAVILVLCSGVFAAGTTLPKGSMTINPKDGAVMVWVPAGWFIMGSTDTQITSALNDISKNMRYGEEDYFNAEKPQKKAYLDGYWMYKYEVTVAQYRKFCDATKRTMPEAPSWGWINDHPITNMTWQDATDYANWADVSLPTEAQWEKASRGTDGRLYPWGYKWDASKCANSVENPSKSTMPVGSYPAGASPYGCMDMSGNVWEWCADWYDEKYYKNAPVRNPTGPSKPVELKAWGVSVSGSRVLRGCSWTSSIYYNFRCASRNCNYLTVLPYKNDYGFRCAKNQ